MNKAMVVSEEISLPKIARQINEEHRLCEQSMRDGLQHAINAGNLLLTAKKQCRHGAWGDWLRENCTVSERTAQMYMRVARGRSELEAKAQRVADLSLNGAIALLTAPAEYEVHELGQIFPMMGDDELAALAEGIAEIGLISPIVLFEGKILDGKCRYEACKRAGITPHFSQFPDDYPEHRGSALDFIFNANLHRAHYNETQRAVMAIKIERLRG